MSRLVWEEIKHATLAKEVLVEVAMLKDQHWKHGIDSQIEWIRNNTQNDDLHVLGRRPIDTNLQIVAYCTLSNVAVKLDGVPLNAIGLGSVCVNASCKREGYGRELLDHVGNLLLEEEKRGILLCRDQLVGFYEKGGWSRMRFSEAEVGGNIYNQNIMLFGTNHNCSAVSINRNF